MKFRGECEKEPKRAAALGALVALAAKEKANITEAQRRSAVMAEVQNILDFEVLSWTPRSEVSSVEWTKRVLTRIFTILKSDNVTIKSRQITGSLWRPHNPADCQKGENYAPTAGFFVCLAFIFYDNTKGMDYP